jgi:hypothetical protein
MRRLARSAVLIAVLVMAVFAVTACGASGKKAPVPPRISVRVGALVVAVPRGFSRTDVRGHGRLLGALVADYRVMPGSPTLREAIFPANGVVLSVGRAALGALPPMHPPPLRLPLTLNGLRGPQHHADGTAWVGVFGFQGWVYTVAFWVGRTAPPHDRAALESVLGSIRHAP